MSDSTSSDSTSSDSTSSDEAECVELKHDSQRVFEPMGLFPSNLMQQMMSKMGVPKQMIQMMNLMQPIVPITEDLPANLCVFLPHAPNKNILRIIGHYNNNNNKNEKQNDLQSLIISSNPIDCVDTNSCNSCEQICKYNESQHCQCINAQQIISPFDAMSSQENGFDGTIMYVTPPIEAGKKYITTMHGNIGFEVFSMFTDIIQHDIPTENKISHLMVAPPKTANSDLMYIGGKSIKNILLNHLNGNINSFTLPKTTQVHNNWVTFGHKGEMPPPQHKINLIMSLNANDNPLTKSVSPQVKMSAIPLAVHDSELQLQHMKECVINQDNTEQCSVYINGDFDYDIRIENIGGVMADINVFTMEIPTNDMQPPVDMDMDMDMDIHDDIIIMDLSDMSLPPQAGRPSQVPFVIGAIAAMIIISFIALFTVRKLKKQKRKRSGSAAHGAYVSMDNEGNSVHVEPVITVGSPIHFNDPNINSNSETETPFVSMDEAQLSYQVFSASQ